jgi:hypothetical protein
MYKERKYLYDRHCALSNLIESRDVQIFLRAVSPKNNAYSIFQNNVFDSLKQQLNGDEQRHCKAERMRLLFCKY